MSHPLYKFGVAYQEQLLKNSPNSLPHKDRIDGSLWIKQFRQALGNGLITVGEKVKGSCACPELSQRRV